MDDINDIPDRQWWAMCDFHMSHPTPLESADLLRPFVYARGFGVCYVPMGMHQGAMSLLLAFQHGLYCGIDVAEKLKLRFSEETADYWLQNTPGAAFRSSVGNNIQIGSKRGLTPLERRLFSTATVVFD